MNKITHLLSLTALVCCITCLSACAVNKTIQLTHSEKYFNFILPEGFEVTKTVSMEDFDVYKVSKNGKAFIGIYVGNQPKFPSADKNIQGNATTSTSPEMDSFSILQEQQLIHREVLFKLKETNGWPNFVHAWTSDVPTSQVDAANKILSSIVVSKAN